MATGQTEKFPVHSKHYRLACFAKNGRKKAVNLFQDLLLHVLSLGGGLFNFGIGWAAALLAVAPCLLTSKDSRGCQRRAQPVHLDR